MKNITGAQGAFIARLLIEAYQSKGQRILEAGYTGQKKDKLGHTRYYSNGKQVKNPNATEKAAIHAAAGQSLPAGQSPSHADAATRVDALHKDTPPEHVAALANDLMKMSVADLTKLSKGPAPKDANGLSDKHKADYKAALDAQEDADTAEGKIAAGKEVENIVRGIADDMGIDFFDAYDMLEKENDEAGLTPGYAPPTDDLKKKDNVTPPTAPPTPAVGMSADANALDALRLKSNKKTHNPAHINPEALSSLKAQGFIDDKNKLTNEGRAHLYAEKLKGAPSPTGTAAGAPAAPKPKWKRAARNKDSLISIVKRKGGINSDSVKAGYDYQADIIEGGLLHAIRKQGMGLDEMAQSLMVEGHIIVPEGVDPGEHLLSEMKARHHSALRNTDKEIESEEAAYYKAKQAALEGGHDERSIEGSGRSGAQTGESAGQKEGATELDEWDNSGAGAQGSGEENATVTGDGYDSADADDYDRNATGQVDNSFDFGANADEPKANEPTPAPNEAPAPTAAAPPPDDAVARHMQRQAFTGVDSQGRQWQNGELVATKDDEPAAPAGKADPEPKPEKRNSYAGENGDVIQTPGGFIDVQFQKNATSPRKHSVVGFVVDEDKRGQGIGDKLLKQAKEKYSDLGGQVSSKASLKVFYNNGFRSPDMPEASFAETLQHWQEEGGSLFMAANDEDGSPYSTGNEPKQPTKPTTSTEELSFDEKEKYKNLIASIEKQLDPTKNDLSRYSKEKIDGVIKKLNDYRAKLGLPPHQADAKAEPEPEPKAAPEPAAAPAAAAPEPDPVTEPSTPAAAAAEPQPNDTPRTQAARVSAALAGDFEKARASAVPNMGEDIKGAARHKRTPWKGLKDAEANGTAEALVKRDELLKNNPSNLSTILSPKTALGVLTSHLAMQAFPKEVHQYAKYVKSAKDMVSTPEQLREQYYEAFTEIKKLSEDLATQGKTPKEIASELKTKVSDLIDKFRKKGQGEDAGYYMIKGKTHYLDGDKYNPVANSLADMYNRLQKTNATSVLGRVNDFGKRLHATTTDGKPTVETLQTATKAIGDVLEGKSFNQAFDTVEKKGAGFDYNSAYGSAITRTGGKKIDMNEQSTTSPGAKVFMDDMKVRGVQFGNSLPDQERVYHAEKSAEALSDLTGILGLPDEAAGLGGKLGLAIGARGRQGAKAHFEPWQADDKDNPEAGGPVINLTRANGAGSLAHEWGHGLDHYAANNKTGGNRFLSDLDNGSPESNGAMGKVHEAMQSSGFNKRLREAAIAEGLSNKEFSYWNSSHEKFARTFERHVQNKLHEAGRENTYLTGLHKQGHPLWPTNDEMAHMAPHMDALIAAIAAEKFPNHTMPTPAPAAPRAAAPAPAAPAPKEEKPATATAAWKQRGSNEKESPYQSFQAIHGRPPSFDELHGNKFEKTTGKYILKPNQGGTITDVTPAGYGPGEADTPPAAKWTAKPSSRINTHDPYNNSDYDDKGNYIAGSIAGIPITTNYQRTFDGISDQTKAALEKEFSDPKIIAALKDAGIKNLHMREDNDRAMRPKWTMAHSQGSLLFNRLTAQRIKKNDAIRARQKDPLKPRGLRGVIFHEAGHGLYGKAGKDLQNKFQAALAKHPEVKDFIASKQSIKAPMERFDDMTPKEYEGREVHAEVYAIKDYDPERFESFPEEIKQITNEIEKKGRTPGLGKTTEATMPTNDKAQKIKLVQAIIARRGLKPPEPKAQAKKIPEASGDADPRVKRIRELMDAYC